METLKMTTKTSWWNKLPIMVRAILSGFLISTIGIAIGPILARIVPLPIAGILSILFLIGYIKYFSGSWAPKSTQVWRKINFRSTKLTVKQWVVASIAATMIVLVEQSGLIVTFRLTEFPSEQFKAAYSFIDGVPLITGWIIIVAVSLFAGVCEETGYRGYMQEPLEKKYGPIGAIGVTSLVFVLVHLHQAWSGPILFHIFFIGMMFGSIAYFSHSLIPGIIAHIVMDVFNFAFWWTDLGGQFDGRPIYETGLDNHFLIWSVVLLISMIVFVVALNTLRRNWAKEQEVS